MTTRTALVPWIGHAVGGVVGIGDATVGAVAEIAGAHVDNVAGRNVVEDNIFIIYLRKNGSRQIR